MNDMKTLLTITPILHPGRWARLLACLFLIVIAGGLLSACSRRSAEPDATLESPADPAPAARQERVRPASAAIPTNRLAYSAFSQVGTNPPQALIEDVVLRQGSYRKAGQQAFGYTVRDITLDWVTLERDGAEFQLRRSTNLAELRAPGITPENYPPGFVQTSTNLNPHVPAAPPPESAVIQSVRPEELPSNVQTQLQERLRQKTAGRK
jgi:hypothetical protein